MPAPAHVQAETLGKFVDGWTKITPESWTAIWSDDCTQQFLPLSLGIPPQTREEVLVLLPKLLSMLKNWKLNVYDTVHDAAKGKAVIYAISEADTPFDDFRWTNEYSVFISFTEDGEKIAKIEEMVDTAFYREFQHRFQKYISSKDISD